MHMMMDKPAFIGLDLLRRPGKNRRGYVYARLDDALNILAVGTVDRNELLTYINTFPSAYLAINAPLQPANGLMDARTPSQPALIDAATSTRRVCHGRLAEALLNQQGIPLPLTPLADMPAPAWMKRSFDLVRRLKMFNFEPFPQENHRLMIETSSQAAFWRALGNNPPMPETTLEGRMQRQLVLFELGVELPDPMDFFMEITRHRLLKGNLAEAQIYPVAALNAVMAARTANLLFRSPQRVSALGDAEEGQIVLPLDEPLVAPDAWQQMPD